jgi:hypothetical protein
MAREAAFEQRDCFVVASRQLADLRGETQLLERHVEVRRRPQQVLSRACVIALPRRDVAEAFQRFAVIGGAGQDVLQQAGGFIQLPGRGVLLRGEESLFDGVIHDGVIGRKNSQAANGKGPIVRDRIRQVAVPKGLKRD